MTRRTLLATLGTAAGAAFAARPSVFAQPRQAPPTAPTVISNPPRDFGPGASPTTYFNDPDVLTIDPP